MTEPLKIGVLGCGRVVDRYIDVFENEIADIVQPVVACDVDLARTTPFVKRFGARAVTDIEGVVAEKPDLVCVLTRSGEHVDHVLALLDAGCNVVVEKPVALKLEDAEKMHAAAVKKGLMCAVVKQNRYNPAVRFARRMVDEGRFGQMVMCSFRLHWCRPQEYYEDGWHGTWAMDGGVLMQQAIHHVDSLRWLAGPVDSVCAHGIQALNRLEAEDTAIAMLRYSSGAVGTIEATTSARPRDFEASITLMGEKAMLRIGGTALNVVETWNPVDPRPEDEGAAEKNSQEVPSGLGLGHGPYLRELIERLQEGRTDAPVDVPEATNSLQLVHALYASMESGGWVDLASKPKSKYLGVSAGA